MYCTNCGNKLKNNSNYCNKCGKKIIKNVNKNNDDYKVLCMIIGILSIIGSLVINIMICPLAIFGIIISIKYHQKQELILNIIACIIAIIIFTLIILFLFQIPNIAKNDYKETIPNYKYDDKYNNDDYNYNKKLDINITGTWYLYKDNTLNNGTYYKFLGGLQPYGMSQELNPKSPFYVNGSIGVLRQVLSGGNYDNINSDYLAKQRADFELYQRCRLQDSVTLTTVPIYWLDTNWLIEITLPNKSDENKRITGQFLIKSINITLGTDATQTIKLMRYYPYYNY